MALDVNELHRNGKLQADPFIAATQFDDGPTEDTNESEPDPDPEPTAETETKESESPADIVRRWVDEGPLVRLSTGFPTLDAACRGGLRVPWRVGMVGAPSACKTGIENVLARHLGLNCGAFVGLVAVDEEPEDMVVRQAMMAGFTIEDCERRDPATLAQLAAELERLPMRFYGADWTIEAAAADVSERAKARGLHPVMFIDTAQTAQARASETAESARERVEAVVRAQRWASSTYRMLVFLLSEANRNSYRNEQATEQGSDMAAGAESRTIEFSAQTLMMLRTPKGHPNVVHVRVPKNRGGVVGQFEFWLRFDRERHTLTECADPTGLDAEEHAVKKADTERTANKASVAADAQALAAVVRGNPGISERDLRGALRAKGHRWGVDRIGGAKALLTAGLKGDRLINRGEGQRCSWHLDRSPEEAQS